MFGNFLKRLFVYKKKELEANLRPVSESAFGGAAEIELSIFSNGSLKAELSAKHTNLPDLAVIDFFANGTKIGSLEIRQGRGKKYLSLNEKQLPGILNLNVGDRAHLSYENQTIFEGHFRLD